VELSGRVLDEREKPIAKADVSVMIVIEDTMSTLSTEEPIATDKDGRFVLKALPAGCRYTLYARADKYGRATREVEIPAAHAKPMQVKDFVLLLANLSVSGIVVDEKGKPVKGATVQVRSGEDDVFGDPKETTTDKAGKFAIKGFARGKVLVSADVPGTELSANELAKAGDKNVKIVVRKGGTPLPETMPARPETRPAKAPEGEDF